MDWNSMLQTKLQLMDAYDQIKYLQTQMGEHARRFTAPSTAAVLENLQNEIERIRKLMR